MEDVPWFTQVVVYLIKLVPSVGILIVLIFIDLLSGTVAAGIEGEANSKASYAGIMKKCQMLIMVMTAHIMEYLFPDVPWGKVVALFFCGYEILSITENSGRAGLPLPIQLKQFLKMFKESMHEADRKSREIDVNIHADPTVVKMIQEKNDADRGVDPSQRTPPPV